MILVLMRSCWGSRERQRRLPISNSGAEHTKMQIKDVCMPTKRQARVTNGEAED